LLAGASGSGKSRVARLTGCPRLALDDFYLDGDHPDLPRTLGIVDWDSIASWDSDEALAALSALSEAGVADVPRYDIAANARVGTQRLDCGDAGAFIAEGIFAPDMLPHCVAAGLEVDGLYLDRSRTVTLVLRFIRDLREHRKPPAVLIRRGLALWRAAPRIRAHALALGCRPVSVRRAMKEIAGASAAASHAPADWIRTPPTPSEG
jgi:uridine kinase